MGISVDKNFKPIKYISMTESPYVYGRGLGAGSHQIWSQWMAAELTHIWLPAYYFSDVNDIIVWNLFIS